ncbi:MAG TPA: TonB-dependent receptor [Polyangiaceae bacterium]|nr:TonB-dependent receptor [Polyangiaceae bacterium]
MKARATWSRTLGCLTLLIAGALGGVARADNLADEAELEFEIGAERYRVGDFRSALEHFLASNRLVPNRNVVFNVARAYEQLNQNADAYRYFNQALEGESDPAARARIDAAIARIVPHIAVLRVASDPPGAIVYLTRRDLGSRGNAPVALGLAPGAYHVLADLPGYEPAEAVTGELAAGSSSEVVLHLKQDLGKVRVEGTPAGASVRIDDEEGPAACTLPCALDLPPGRHAVFASAPAYRTAVVTASVTADGAAQVRVDLSPVTATLLVASEIDGALIAVDGRPSGFTPAALTLPLGVHVVRVTRAGYRSFEQRVDVTPDGRARVDADLSPLEEVTAVSRVTESVADAPSSVSIIGPQELRAMAYPTIAEALRGVRGVYVGNDTSYEAVGFRGFSQLGDYGDHVLVLIDGQPANDDYVGSSYVGYDGRADIEDVQRIEVVRGPGSALYGTGAFFGVINLVTRDRGAPTHGEVSVSTASDSVGHARATAQVRLGPEAGGWVSVAGAHGVGADYFFPEYASDAATAGNARGVDGFETGTVNGRVWYRALTLQWLFTSRKKTLPSGEFETLFADPRTHFVDTRGLVELRFEPTVSSSVQLLSRAHANLYDFGDLLAYGDADGGPAAEAFHGRWAGIERRAVFTPTPAIRLTAGGEVQRHFEAKQTGNRLGGSYLDRDDPFSVVSGYFVGDVSGPSWLKVSAGSRLDYHSNFGSSFNPRVAVILRPYASGNVKLLGGTAFRAPSVYELYYAGPTQIPGGALDPEHVASGEVEFTHTFSSAWIATAAAYMNRVDDLIVLGGSGTVQDPNRYVNSANSIATLGAEIEARREWRNGWMAAATYAFQHSRYLDDAASGGGPPPLRNVPNSPNHLASIKAAAPIAGPLLTAMTRLSFEGPRYDKFDRSADPPQGQTASAVIWDVVLSGETERYRLRYSLGLYNAMDYRYTVPVSREFLQRSIVQSGRTLLLNTQLSF